MRHALALAAIQALGLVVAAPRLEESDPKYTCAKHPLSWSSCQSPLQKLVGEKESKTDKSEWTTNVAGYRQIWYDPNNECVLRLSFEDYSQTLNLTESVGDFTIDGAVGLAAIILLGEQPKYNCQGKGAKIYLPTRDGRGGFLEGKQGWTFEALNRDEAFNANIDLKLKREFNA